MGTTGGTTLLTYSEDTILQMMKARKEMYCRLQLIVSIVTIAAEVVSIKFSIAMI